MKCQHEGCNYEADADHLECTIKNDQGEDVVDGYYCGEHAALHGFCPCCGDYWGGVTSFEDHGFCDHCWDELKADEDRYGDYDCDDFDDSNEPIGSCDVCEINIYADDDDGSGLCDQCRFYSELGCPEQRASE